MQKQYNDVLQTYSKELKANRKLFEDGKERDVVSLNKPPAAGVMSWARSIFNRIQ